MNRILPLATLMLLASCAPSQTGGLFGSTSVGATSNGADLARAYTPAQTGWVYPFFFPDQATRRAACDQGYASASSAQVDPPGELHFTSTEGVVFFTSGYSQTYQVCRDIGLKAGARPESVPPQGPGFTFFYKNFVNFADVAAAAVFLDAGGQEVYRIQLLDGSNASRFYSNVSRNFTAAYALVLDPNTLGVPQKAAIAKAASLRIQVNFGKGIESFEINQTKFPDLR